MAFYAGPYSACDSEIEREYRSAVTVIPSAWALMSAVELTSYISTNYSNNVNTHNILLSYHMHIITFS